MRNIKKSNMKYDFHYVGENEMGEKAREKMIGQKNVGKPLLKFR